MPGWLILKYHWKRAGNTRTRLSFDRSMALLASSKHVRDSQPNLRFDQISHDPVQDNIRMQARTYPEI